MTDGFPAYLQEHQARFFMEYLLAHWFPGRTDLDPTYPGSNNGEREAVKTALLAHVPLDSVLVDLYDWDVHFANELSDDWFFAAVTGPVGGMNEAAQELAEFFVEQVDKLGLDYNQGSQSPEAFQALVLTWSRDFVMQWRQRIVDHYTVAPPAPLVVEG